MDEYSITSPSDSDPFLHVVGFWRRVFAFAVDSLVLGTVGLLLSWPLFDVFVRIGRWGWLIGYFVSVCYFGLLNSSIGSGQTLGKRLFHARVIGINGKFLSPEVSFLRSAILLLPFFINSRELTTTHNFVVEGFQSVVIFGLGLPIIYLVIFNRPTRRSLHDFATGSIVFDSGDEVYGGIPPVWRGHLIAIATIITVMAALISIFTWKLAKNGTLAELVNIQSAVTHTGSYHNASVFKETTWGSKGKKISVFRVSARIDRIPDKADLEQLAQLAINTDAAVLTVDYLRVDVYYGYDIGIAHFWRSLFDTRQPTDWSKT